MIIDKTLTGFIIISDIINGYLETRKYQGYTLAQAKLQFKNEFYK